MQIPCDPKLLVKPVTDQQLASFWLTTLEKNPRKDLFLEPDNGVPIKLLDLDQYEIPEHPPPLAPEDEALLAVSRFPQPLLHLPCVTQSVTRSAPTSLSPNLAAVQMLAVQAAKDSPCFRSATKTNSIGAQEAPKKLAGKTMAAGAGAPHQELSWLMRTSYISSGSQQVRKLDAAKPVEEAVDESLDAQMDAIEVCAWLWGSARGALLPAILKH